MKRKIFLAISIIIAILPIISVMIIPVTQKILIAMLFYLILVVITIITQVFIAMKIKIPPENFITSFLGLLTLRMKKTFHSDLGEFYMETEFKRDEANVSVYEQNYLYLIRKFDLSYYGDIDDFKKRLKNKLEYTYRQELNEINKQKEMKKKWKNWSGAVDIQSEREMKLNELTK